MEKRISGFFKNYKKQLNNIKDEELNSYILNNILKVDKDIKISAYNNITRNTDNLVINQNNCDLGFLSDIWYNITDENKCKIMYWKIMQVFEQNDMPNIDKIFDMTLKENFASFDFNKVLFSTELVSNRTSGLFNYINVFHELKHYYDYLISTNEIKQNDKHFLNYKQEVLNKHLKSSKIFGASYFDNSSDTISEYVETTGKQAHDNINDILFNVYNNYPIEYLAENVSLLALKQLLENKELLPYISKKDRKKYYGNNSYYNDFCKPKEEYRVLYKLNDRASYYKTIATILMQYEYLMCDNDIPEEIDSDIIKKSGYPNIMHNIVNFYKNILNDNDFERNKNLFIELEKLNDVSLLKKFTYLFCNDCLRKLDIVKKDFFEKLTLVDEYDSFKTKK